MNTTTFAIQTATAHREAKLAERAALEMKIAKTDAVIGALDALIADLRQHEPEPVELPVVVHASGSGPSVPQEPGNPLHTGKGTVAHVGIVTGSTMWFGSGLPLAGVYPDVAVRIKKIVDLVNASDTGVMTQIALIHAMTAEDPKFTRNHLITAVEKGREKGILEKEPGTGAISVSSAFAPPRSPPALAAPSPSADPTPPA